MRLVQPSYQIGGDNIVVGADRYQNVDCHILREQLARRRRRALVSASTFSQQCGVLQRHYTRAFEAPHRERGDGWGQVTCESHALLSIITRTPVHHGLEYCVRIQELCSHQTHSL